jgi:hypothetical protein
MSADELAMLRELRGGERAATPPVLPQATMGDAPGTLVPGGSGLTEPPATARALSEEPEPRRFGSEPGNSVRESTAARAALTVVHDFGLQEKLHAGAEPWRRAAERWGLQSDNHEAQRLEYTVTSSLVFAPEPGSTSHKTIFDVMHAADTARQGRKAGHQKGVAEACPYCAPRVCGADCGWAAQRVRAVEIPFRPAPSRCWPVMIWSFVGLILAAAIGATVYWGIDRTGEHPVNGCGDTEGETQARLLMVGIAKTRLIGMCPQLRMSLAKAAQVEPEVVALTKITDVQSRRSLGPWRNPARELTGARQAETAVAVELTCSFSAGSANASTATNASSAWRRPLRRSGGYRYLADSRLRRAALGALEESISTGALSSAIRDDWGVEVKVIFLGIPSEVVASSADDQQQQQPLSIVCPEHSSAPPGSISADLCTCDPGFYKVGKVCYLCDPSSYSKVLKGHSVLKGLGWARSSPSLLVALFLPLLSFPAFAQLSNKRLSRMGRGKPFEYEFVLPPAAGGIPQTPSTFFTPARSTQAAAKQPTRPSSTPSRKSAGRLGSPRSGATSPPSRSAMARWGGATW